VGSSIPSRRERGRDRNAGDLRQEESGVRQHLASPCQYSGLSALIPFPLALQTLLIGETEALLDLPFVVPSQAYL